MNRPTDELDSQIDMERILAALPPQQRRAVRLYARGLSYREISYKFGVSENAIKCCFRRIRAKVKKLDTF
jgi:RNA polymerase sigma factor (sigma-70 family)